MSQLWLAPSTRGPARTAALNEFAAAVKLEVDSNFAKALPIFMQPDLRQGPLGHYAEYYQGLAELRLGRAADARQTFQALRGKNPAGYLVEAAALREAECDEALNDQDGRDAGLRAAVEDQDDGARRRADAASAAAAKAAGNPDKAAEAYRALDLRIPVQRSGAAGRRRARGLPIAPIAAGSNRFKLELGRAERLFGAKRYAQARPAFDGLRSARRATTASWCTCGIAECDYFLKRARIARDGVRPYLDKASRQGEALFFYAVATRELGDHDEYLRIVRRIVAGVSDQSWAEEALNNLATHYILQNDDESADEDVPRDVREVPDRPLRGARGLEDRLVGVQERQLRRHRARVRSRRRRIFRARTIGRRGCTGRRARTRR